MNDPNARFVSSLRSPGKAASRRSSLNISGWHDESAKKQPVPSSVRRYSTSASPPPPQLQPQPPQQQPQPQPQPQPPLQLTSSLLPFQPSFEATPNAESKEPSSSFWEPPISCKRRTVRCSGQGDYYSFFPIEISGRDYFHRFIALVVRVVDLLDIQYLAQTQSPHPLRELHPLLVDEFVHLLVANSPDYHLEEYAQKMELLLRQSEPTSNSAEECMQLILEWKSRLFSHRSGWGSSRLSDMPELIGAVEQMLSLMLGYYQSSAPQYYGQAPGNDHVRCLQDELRSLHNQLRVHVMFQNERMTTLGWNWDPTDSLEDPQLKPEEKWKQAFVRYEHLLSCLTPYLAPPSKALLSLISRVAKLEEELQQLSEYCSDLSEYDEAQRLRDLVHAMEVTLNAEHCLLYDNLNGYIFEARALATELEHFIVLKRQQRLFDQAKASEEAAVHLQQLCRELSQNIQPMKLLRSSALFDRVNREGTAFIVSDFLFLCEQWPDQQSVASLLIRSASQSMLTAIEHWPGLTALKTSVYLRTQTQQMIVYQGEGQDVWPGSPNQEISADGYFLGQDGGLEHHDMVAALHESGQGLQSSELVRAYQTEVQSQSSSFSMQVLDALKAFDMLQQELNQLLTVPAVAHSQLICRLIGISNDLRSLTDISDHTSQPYAQGQSSLLNAHSNSNLYASESDRLRSLIAAVEGSIDADEQTAVDDSQVQANLCGRKRVDYIWQVINRIKPGIRELMKLKSLARNYRDFSAAAALETMQVSLESRVRAVEASIVSFSMLDTDNDMHFYDSSVDVNERIAREGSGFITADYIFSYSCGTKGHSVGSLAIVAGAGAILRHIKQNWPHLTALGNSGMPVDLSLEGSVTPNGRKRSVTAVAMSSSGAAINFHDANALRLLGFDPETLRIAGFSNVDILTSGFTADQLKMAGFDAQSIHSAIGLNADQMFCLTSASSGGNAMMLAAATSSSANAAPILVSTASGGHALEVVAQLLREFYDSTRGISWKSNRYWPELKDALNVAANNYTKPDGTKISLLTYQGHLKQVLFRLQGIQLDRNSLETQKLILPQNQLSGSLPVSLGSIITLQQIVLSNNNLSGAIPASLGLLVNLQILVLDHNKLQGEIPRTLKHLQQLTILRLEHNQLEGCIPPALGNLSKLKRLDLSHNQLSGGLPLRLGSSGMMQLQEVLLNNNSLSGVIPSTWVQLTHLIHLDLHSNQLQGQLPSGFESLSKLTGLNLQDNAGIQVNRQQLQKCLPKCRIKL